MAFLKILTVRRATTHCTSALKTHLLLHLFLTTLGGSYQYHSSYREVKTGLRFRINIQTNDGFKKKKTTTHKMAPHNNTLGGWQLEVIPND